MGRSRVAPVVAVCAAVAFVALGVLVAAHVTQPLDAAARTLFRPHGEWGAAQVRADVVVEGAKPRNILLLLPVVGVCASIWRASWRPAAYAALIAVSLVAVTLLSKLVVHRADPHGAIAELGGSFPSGHVASVLVCVGGAVLVLHERPQWWEWAVVGLAGAVMGLAVMVQAAHWFTDVLGGTLLAFVLLAVASMSSLRRSPGRAPVAYRGDAPARSEDRRGERRADLEKKSADSPRN